MKERCENRWKNGKQRCDIIEKKGKKGPLKLFQTDITHVYPISKVMTYSQLFLTHGFKGKEFMTWEVSSSQVLLIILYRNNHLCFCLTRLFLQPILCYDGYS